MRDRLIELLTDSETAYAQHLSEKCDKVIKGDIVERLLKRFEFYADYLLTNGVIVPPCKVGQNVWLIKSLNWQHTEWGIKEGKISMIQQKADKSWKFRITENHSVEDYTVDSIGKTVFLTREEAEQALKGGAE